MDGQAMDRIKRFLDANGFDVRKSEIAWILNQMSQALEGQIEEWNGVVERRLICEVITTAKQVKVITELPGVSEEEIELNVYDSELEIDAENEKRKYYEVIHLPAGTDTGIFKSTFLNGLLEVTFEKNNSKVITV
jgi:HSP20 family protein